MQSSNGNGKPSDTKQPDQRLIRVGCKPRRTISQIEPEANWKDYGRMVSQSEQPSSIFTDWHASTDEGDKCRDSRKKWC